jgi:hypothetical protein
MNFLPGTLVAAEPTQARVALRDGTELTCAVDATRAARGAEPTVGVRPEHTSPVAGSGRRRRPPGSGCAARSSWSRTSASALIYVRLPGTEGLTLCRIEGASLTRAGEHIEIGIAPGGSTCSMPTARRFRARSTRGPAPSAARAERSQLSNFRARCIWQRISGGDPAIAACGC